MKGFHCVYLLCSLLCKDTVKKINCSILCRYSCGRYSRDASSAKMDTILRGLLSSDKKESIKKSFVNKIAKNGSEPKQSNDIQKMFFLCYDTIVNSDDEFSLWACKHIYEEWARYNSSTLDSVFDRDRLLFFLNGNFTNNSGAVWIIHETLIVLNKTSSPNFVQLCQTVEMKAISYVREHPQVKAVTQLCKLLKDFNQCIPKGDLTATFCISIINAVSSFTVPDNQSAVLEVKYQRTYNKYSEEEAENEKK